VSALLAPPAQPFSASIAPLSQDVCARVTNKSWRDDPRCPRFDQLAYLDVAHVTFDGGVGVVRLAVAAALAPRAAVLGEAARDRVALGPELRRLRVGEARAAALVEDRERDPLFDRDDFIGEPDPTSDTDPYQEASE